MSDLSFAQEIQEGIPTYIPTEKPWDSNVNHAPKRKDILSKEEKKLAIANALRYFPKEQHAELAKELKNRAVEYIDNQNDKIIDRLNRLHKRI